MRPSAPYTRETLEVIRTQAALGIHALAEMLGWEEARLSTIAKRHGIEVKPAKRSDGSAPPMSCAGVEATAFVDTSRLREDAGRPARRKKNARTCYASIAISREAVAGIAAIAKAEGKRATGVVGIVVDYLARNGELADVLQRAKAEAA